MKHFGSTCACAVAAVFVLIGSAAAAPIIHGPENLNALGTYRLLPDTPGQEIEVFVRPDENTTADSGETADDEVQGVNFNIQVGDGGPEAGRSDDGPVITAVDLFTGTIFEGNNTGLGSGAGVLVPQVAFFSTTTASGTVTADGLLATVTIDTTGFFPEDGPFGLVLSQTLNNPTNFGTVSPEITDGQIVIVPEPGTLALFGLAGVALLHRSRRVDRR